MDAEEQVRLQKLLTELTQLRRGSATAGEYRAAELLAGALRDRGARVWTEREQVHPTYWWPLGLPSVVAALAALRGGRLAAAISAAAAAALADDLWVGRRYLRRMLPHRTTVNVVGQYGADGPGATVVVSAHHDAAHTGLTFRPWVLHPVVAAYRALLRGRPTMPPVFWLVLAGPVLVAVGALTGVRRLRVLGAMLASGTVGVMAQIGRAPVVPGANDNASSVVALAGVAGRLARRPPQRVRVLLVSTGSEESLLEGMRAWLARNAAQLRPEQSWFLCLESVGSAHLNLLAAEGMVRAHRYPDEPAATVREVANRLGVPVRSGLCVRVATDGQVPLLAGYPVATLMSVDDGVVPRNYHLPDDRPETLQWTTIEDTIDIAAEVIARLGAQATVPA